MNIIERTIMAATAGILAAFAVLALSGCTTLTVERPDGTKFRTMGAPLVNREGEILYVDEWLDAENNVHQTTIRQSGKEGTDNQLEAFRMMFEAGQKVGVAGGSP